MDGRFGGEPADHVDLKGRGAVKAAHARCDEVFDHLLARIGLDRIGHKTSESLDEALRCGLKHRGRKEQHRVLRLLRGQEFGRIGPY